MAGAEKVKIGVLGLREGKQTGSKGGCVRVRRTRREKGKEEGCGVLGQGNGD